MTTLNYLSAISSSAFRAFTYIFLQVAPVKFGKWLLPLLYLVYAVPAYLSPPLGSTAPKKPMEETKDSEGDDKTKTTAPVKPAPRDHFWDVLLSLPTTSTSKLVTFALNTLLLLAAADFTLSPVFNPASEVVFTRVGAVYPDSAKVFVRYPSSNESEQSVFLLWRRAADVAIADAVEPWKDGPSLTFASEFDWANTTILRGLWPNTAYEYVLADVNKTLLEYPATPIRFRTFPDPRIPGGTKFRFLASSCLTPNFPYLPFHGRTIKGFDLLADYYSLGLKQNRLTPGIISPVLAQETDNSTESLLPLEASLDGPDANDTLEEVPDVETPSVTPPEFMIFLGDFVYADVPFYFGDNKEAYRRLYRRNYQSPSFRRVYEHLPIVHTYDDHEIIDNYVGLANDTPPFVNAADPFKLYNADVNYDSAVKDQHYYDFRYGDVAFFVMDTRRYRSGVDDPIEERTMLGDEQLSALYGWLGKVNNTATFKFIVTSVPFTSLWGLDAQIDTWAGYEFEKATLLDALHSVPNVILISGDRHEFAAIEFNAKNADAHPVYEFSTSPLNMFYVPFIRTLSLQSEAVVERTELLRVDEESDPVEIVKEIPQEKVIKYLPLGNHKWSSFEVDTTNPAKPTVKVEVIIDGKLAYNLDIVGTPVKLRTFSSAIGAVTEGLKDMLGRVGFAPTRWF
ncbi:PhoD-like phosphatase-domain-containing protein [Amylostereum chailletii]|nr:PhoD-like phosphatase-domain-containing protein [Amylostereum chailletii]